MSNIVEIKLDHTSLPNDGDKVEYQTQDNLEEWKVGVYDKEAGLFCHETDKSIFNCHWTVSQWRKI